MASSGLSGPSTSRFPGTTTSRGSDHQTLGVVIIPQILVTDLWGIGCYVEVKGDEEAPSQEWFPS